MSKRDIDGYFCAGDAPGLGTASMVEYLGLTVRHMDSSECGGSAPILHVAHAAQAIALGKCNVALVTLGGRPRAAGASLALKPPDFDAPDLQFEMPYAPVTQNLYALVARRYMHEFGTTSEQLAWIKVAASHHAQHNVNAMLRQVVTVEDVLNSPLVSDPLHRLDCCVISDGGGAVIVARPEIAKSLNRPKVRILGCGEASKNSSAGKVDLTYSAAAFSGPAAFVEAGIRPADIKYASIYDSFTITVVITLEDLGFCKKGEGGKFVDVHDLTYRGDFPVNTGGGELSVGQAGLAGGFLHIVEALRQLRGEADGHQVKKAERALVTGIGWLNYGRNLGTTAALVMERR